MNYLTSTLTKLDVLGVQVQVIEVKKLEFHIHFKKYGLEISKYF